MEQLVAQARELVDQYYGESWTRAGDAKRKLEERQNAGAEPDELRRLRKQCGGTIFPRVRERANRPQKYDILWERWLWSEGAKKPRPEYIRKGTAPNYPMTQFRRATDWERELIERYEPAFAAIRRLIAAHASLTRLRIEAERDIAAFQKQFADLKGEVATQQPSQDRRRQASKGDIR